MVTTELLQICKAYNNLGFAIQDQIDDIVEASTRDFDPENVPDLNPNAVKYIRNFVESIVSSSEEELYDDLLFVRSWIDAYFEHLD